MGELAADLPDLSFFPENNPPSMLDIKLCRFLLLGSFSLFAGVEAALPAGLTIVVSIAEIPVFIAVPRAVLVALSL